MAKAKEDPTTEAPVQEVQAPVGLDPQDTLLTVKAYVGQFTVRKDSEAEFKAKDWEGKGDRAGWLATFPKAYPHVFATVTTTPKALFTEPGLCAKGSSGAIVSLQKLVRGDAKGPAGRTYVEGEIDNWRVSFTPDMLEGWDGVPPKVADGSEPFIILDCNNVALEAPLTDEQLIELAVAHPIMGGMVETFLSGIASMQGVEKVTVADLDEEYKSQLARFGRMALKG